MAIVRVAVIGCGGIAAFTHVPQLLADRGRAEIVALCDQKLSRAEALRSRFSLMRAQLTADYREVLDDRYVDAVIVAAWPTQNAAIAIEAISAGKHVLLQKPLMLSGEARARLLEGAQASGQHVLALPFIEALAPFAAMREEIGAGTIGRISFGRIRTTIAGPQDYYADVRRFFGETEEFTPYERREYALDRGCLSDMGPYALAAYHYLFGPGACVSARFSRTGAEDTALLVLTSSSGPALASIEVGWAQHTGIEICSIFGSAGSICMEVNGRIIVHANSPPRAVGSAGALHMLPVSPFDAQKAWLGAIAAGEPPRFVSTVDRAIWIAEVIDESYRRSSSNQTELPL